MYNKYLRKWNGVDLVPIDRDDLRKLVRNCPTDADLNFLDVSGITSMSKMFQDTVFNGHIEKWDVSNAIYMESMFQYSEFDQPIGNWDVSNVTTMDFMFYSSNFNQPIGDWDISSVELMWVMFKESKFDQPIKNWQLSHVKDMESMFQHSQFKSELPNHNMRITDFVDKTELMITTDQLQDNIKTPLNQWCEENWELITEDKLYLNVLNYYVYNHIDDEEKKFNLISKHNLTQFEI